MYAILQGIFTILTMALTVPLFKHYRLHIAFECLKVAASVWNGGIFFFDVMPKKMDAKKKRKFSPTKGPVSLDTTGLPFEGASALDPPLSPGEHSSPNGEAALCSLCRKSSSATDLSDAADEYADQVDEQVRARNGRKMDTEGIALAT